MIRVQVNEHAQLYRCYDCGQLKTEQEANLTAIERTQRELRIVQDYLCEKDLADERNRDAQTIKYEH